MTIVQFTRASEFVEEVRASAIQGPARVTFRFTPLPGGSGVRVLELIATVKNTDDEIVQLVELIGDVWEVAGIDAGVRELADVRRRYLLTAFEEIGLAVRGGVYSAVLR